MVGTESGCHQVVPAKPNLRTIVPVVELAGLETRYLFNAIEALSLMSYSPTKQRTPEDVKKE